ncbi:MAG TPA: hypothetical protein VGR28_13860, partial [Candidatus Thermoplasmatota archaeon]|nr:hypothetical protein [Candidatus Thermoplasmatota archaeon]
GRLLGVPRPLAGAALLAACAAALVVARYAPDRPIRAARPRALRWVLALALASVVAVLYAPVLSGHLPAFVDLPRMVGWPVLALAAVGLVVLPFAGGPGAHLGAGLFLAAFPLVILNPLDSTFWPHRTVVYMGLGAALLAGVAVDRAARAAAAAAARRRSAADAAVLAPAGKAARRAGRRAQAAAVLAAALFMSGTLVAATPAPYPGWYRYYEDCDFRALRTAADVANQHPQTIVLTGSWQSQLVVAAFVDDASRVWYKPEFFRPGYDVAGFSMWLARDHAPSLALLDRYAYEDIAAPATGLQGTAWTQAWHACADAAKPGVAVFRLGAAEQGGP